jgi:hypothetical protein
LPVERIVSDARWLRERGDEPIPLPRHGRDEPGLAPIVLELRPEVADVAIDDVALGHVVDAPERVQDLVARHHLVRSRRQKIEQALFEAGQVQLR